MKNHLSQDKDRKKDHIDLAFTSATGIATKDERFFYEPMLATFPDAREKAKTTFAGESYDYPIWVSSMTGGTGIAENINRNLAKVCREFGLGMGLGSCRKLLTSDEYLRDFDVRHHIGDRPLFANLGIAQINDLIEADKLYLMDEVVKKLQATGLIIHINPLQEWMQPEGDKIRGISPIDAIKRVLDIANYPIIVKEVGQGMGPKSIEALLTLPIAGLEFGAYGGTNFAKLEALRDPNSQEIDPLCYVGHSAQEMIDFIIWLDDNRDLVCKDFIISGGLKNYLDGYYYNSLLPFNSLYGKASGFLKHAMEDYDSLAAYVATQVDGYLLASKYLTVKK